MQNLPFVLLSSYQGIVVDCGKGLVHNLQMSQFSSTTTLFVFNSAPRCIPFAVLFKIYSFNQWMTREINAERHNEGQNSSVNIGRRI